MPWLLYFYDSLNMRQSGPKASQNTLQKSPMPLLGVEPQFLSCSACSPAIVMTMPSQYVYVCVCVCVKGLYLYILMLTVN